MPVNHTAKDYFVEPYVLTEENWIHFQHHLRGLAQDEELKCVLESIKKIWHTGPKTEGPESCYLDPQGEKECLKMRATL